jgi:hypothetical protein
MFASFGAIISVEIKLFECVLPAKGHFSGNFQVFFESVDFLLLFSCLSPQNDSFHDNYFVEHYGSCLCIAGVSQVFQ